jgi:hypothetical protein
VVVLSPHQNNFAMGLREIWPGEPPDEAIARHTPLQVVG